MADMAGGVDTRSVPHGGEDDRWRALGARQLAILSQIERFFNAFHQFASLDSSSLSHWNLPGSSASEADGVRSFSMDGEQGAGREGKPSGGLEELTVQKRLETVMWNGGVRNFKFKRVASNYYECSYEERREQLEAASVQHLCKSIVMVNTQASSDIVDCSNPLNSKYYVLVVQYTAKLHAEKVRNFVYNLNGGKIPKKRFNLRLAPEDVSQTLTGFEHNAVTPIGMKTQIPVILSDAIVKLEPDFFWLGGGEVDLKLGINTQEFIDFVKPFITDCIYD